MESVRTSGGQGVEYDGVPSVAAIGAHGHCAPSLRRRLLPRIFPTPLHRGTGPAILMYHQIADIEHDPWSLAVKPAFFGEHLQILRKLCKPLSLPQLTAEMGRGPLDPRYVVVTFDDGYLDNLNNAQPLLERHDIPATVFVVGDAIGQRSEFWWDQLHHLLLGDHPLPESLQLRISGRKRQWRLGSREILPGVHTWWTRPRLYRALWHELRTISKDERLETIQAVRAWAGRPPEVRPDRQVMTEADLLRLHDAHGIEIGAHTASHPRLSALAPAEQIDEVRRGKERLEEILGTRITSFSYPFGGTFDVSAASVEAVRRAGFARACTTRGALVRRRTNLLRLPRLYVGNWSGEEFERRMASWLTS